jgi:hypothetical protein
MCSLRMVLAYHGLSDRLNPARKLPHNKGLVDPQTPVLHILLFRPEEMNVRTIGQQAIVEKGFASCPGDVRPAIFPVNVLLVEVPDPHEIGLRERRPRCSPR